MSRPAGDGSCDPPCLTPKSSCGKVRQAQTITGTVCFSYSSGANVLRRRGRNRGPVLPPAGRRLHMRAGIHRGASAHGTAEPVCPHPHSGDPRLGGQEG